MLGQGGSLTEQDAIAGISEEQSRLYLETMVAAAPVGLAFVDLDMRYIHINDALAEMNGVPRLAHLGRKVRDVLPDLWPVLEPHYRRVLDEGRPILNLEVSGATPKAAGVPRYFLVNYYPVRDGAGVLHGLGITVVETTESKRAQQAVRMSEQRYRSLVEATAHTVWTTNSRGELGEPAPRWMAFTGQSHGAHLGLGWLDAIHPSDRTRFVMDWAAALETRDPYQGELRLQFHDGTYRDVVIRTVPVFDDGGFVREWISTAEDITGRKHAERELLRTTRALQKGEERYRSFVAQSTEGIWRMEVDPPVDMHLPVDEQVEALRVRAIVAEANETMARMTGFKSPRAMVGTTLAQLIARTASRADGPEDGAVRAFLQSPGFRLENIETRQAGPDGLERVRLANLIGVMERGRIARIWGTQRDVTEQVHATDALRESRETLRLREQQLRTITDALPALVAYLDRDERYLFCNQAFETWFGRRPEEVVGRTVRELSGEMTYAHLRDWVRKALAGEPVQHETAMPLPDGRMIHVQSNYVPSRDARGEVQGVVVLVHDITERKRVEAEVEAQRARLYDILMNIPASIAILNGPEQIYTLANPIYQRVSRGVLLPGKSLRELVRRNRRGEDYSESLREVYESGVPTFVTEMPVRRASSDGGPPEELFFNVTYQPLRDAQGQVDSVMSFAMDVTEQVQARQKAEELAEHLAHQQKWLESMLDLIPVAFLLLEPVTGRTLFANQAAQKMAGGAFPMDVRAEEYAAAFNLTDEAGVRLPDEQIPGVRAARGELLRQVPVVWHTPAGRFSLLVSSELLPAAHGHPATLVLTLQDVTVLQEIQAQLRESVRLRDEFLTVASHELKTPLTPLQIKLQGLAREARSDLPGARLRERVLRATESASMQLRKLTALINDLLDVTQITGAPLPLDVAAVDLSEVVREVAQQFASEASRAGCVLDVRVPGPVWGQWDRRRLEQVGRSLLSNAIKYGPGRPVLLRVEALPGRARLTVRDEGIGIAPENLDRIFEKFGRAVSARNYGGLGLGLFITRCIVEAHHGTLRAESQQGKGASFIVELPRSGPQPPPGTPLH